MNKYAALGLAGEANDGKLIIVISETVHHAQQAMRDFEGLLVEPAHVRRANGDEHVRYPSGGTIHFKSRRQGVRGYSADIVFIDWDVEVADPNFTHEILPAVAATGGVIVRA